MNETTDNWEQQQRQRIEMAADQLRFLADTDTVVPQDREDVLFIAHKFGMTELEHSARSPSWFKIVLSETKYYPEP